MAIVYPLSHPSTPGFSGIRWTKRSVVAIAASPFTGQQQVYAWPGQWWEVEIALPPMASAQAEPWIAFLAALNGIEGTFYLGDSVLKQPRGTISGAVTVGGGAVASTTTLPLAGGTGTFAVGDWLQVGNNLHKVTQVNAGSVDVFPRLRSAYASGTTIGYSNTKGLFRLMANDTTWDVDRAKRYGLTFSAGEALS